MVEVKVKDEEILGAIMDYKMSHDGNSPTYAELGKLVGLRSKGSIFKRVENLIEAGKLIVVDRKICVPGGVWRPPLPAR